MWEAYFNQFMQLRNQLVHAAKKCARKGNLAPGVTPTLSKDMDEQLKLAHKVVDLVDGANRKICVTLLLSSGDKPESSYLQVLLFVRNGKGEKFHQNVNVNWRIEEIIHLVVVMNSVYDEVFAKKLSCNVR